MFAAEMKAIEQYCIEEGIPKAGILTAIINLNFSKLTQDAWFVIFDALGSESNMADSPLLHLAAHVWGQKASVTPVI